MSRSPLRAYCVRTSIAAGPGSVAGVAALVEEALELPCEDVARGHLALADRRLLRVSLLLQTLDELAHVVVLGNRRVDAPLVLAGGTLEVAGVDVHADERLELAHERQGRLGVRCSG